MEENPERYDYWARKEQEIRDYLDKDVAILRDRTGGTLRPMTLVEFRDRKQGNGAQLRIDPGDFGGCGCFVDDAA